MSDQLNTTSVNILGRNYQIKCPQDKANELHRAAHYLDHQLRSARDARKGTPIEQLFVLAALNMAHEKLADQDDHNLHIETMNKRITDLQHKIENFLAQNAQLEL